MEATPPRRTLTDHHMCIRSCWQTVRHRLGRCILGLIRGRPFNNQALFNQDPSTIFKLFRCRKLALYNLDLHMCVSKVKKIKSKSQVKLVPNRARSEHKPVYSAYSLQSGNPANIFWAAFTQCYSFPALLCNSDALFYKYIAFSIWKEIESFFT